MSDLAEQFAQFRARGGVADLSDRLKLKLTGADRVRYLNGQVTANVAKLPRCQAVPACVTTAKGKLCADVFLHATEDALFVDADASLRDTLPARLERYIIADEVLLEDVTGQWKLAHVLASESPTGAVRSRRFGAEGFDLWLPDGEFAGVWAELSSRLTVLDEPLLEALRITAGLPRWGTELDENTLPPEAGLDRTHIDYHKGCYVGQEVISRLKSVGHVNRRLVGLIADDRAPLVRGMRLFATDDPSREVGSLTSTAWSFALDRPIALGYLKRGLPTGALLARVADDSAPGQLVHAQDLPLVS